MRGKRTNRLETIKVIISSREVSSQVELLKALKEEGYDLTQATLSRDLKNLKVAKAFNPSGGYTLVLPNDIMYKRVGADEPSTMLNSNGFLSMDFSGNLALIHTRPGYASTIAYDIDQRNYFGILGTIAGDDTIIMVLREGVSKKEIYSFLSRVIPIV